MTQYLEKLYSGRIGRPNCIFGLLFFAVLGLLIGIIDSYFSYFGILYILILVFLFSMYARRFHDLGMSGWYVLTLFIPIVNLVIFIFYLLLTPGEESSNKYGEIPQKNKFFSDLFKLD